MNIVITGASRGIGFELAKKFVAIGKHNIVVIARNKDKIDELKEICSKINSNSSIFPIQYNLLNVDTYQSVLFNEIKKHITQIDVIVNNAGLLINKPFEKLSFDDISNTINLNLLAPTLLIKSLLPLVNKGGHIVNISSMGGFQGSQKFPGLTVYSAAKAGLASLTECLAEEYKESGISFNCLAIGATDTEMLREAFPGYNAPFSAEEMADFIADFALSKSKFFNGKIIPVSVSTP